MLQISLTHAPLIELATTSINLIVPRSCHSKQSEAEKKKHTHKDSYIYFYFCKNELCRKMEAFCRDGGC